MNDDNNEAPTPSLAEVVTLYETNARQHPVETLHKIADAIENGEYDEVRSITVVLEKSDGSIVSFGLGDQGILRAIGVLQLAITQLANMRLKG